MMILEINKRLYGMNKANFLRRVREEIDDETYRIKLSEFLTEDKR